MSDVPGIEIDNVTDWLEANVVGAVGPFTFDVIAGGHSNLTYRVSCLLYTSDAADERVRV